MVKLYSYEYNTDTGKSNGKYLNTKTEKLGEDKRYQRTIQHPKMKSMFPSYTIYENLKGDGGNS